MQHVEGRGHLLSLFMLSVTLPVSAMALIVLVPRVADTDSGRVALLVLVTPLSLMLCIPTIKLLVLPGVRLARSAWLRRHESEAEYGVTPPRCSGCGYDLRASPDQCPECGTR